MNPSDLLEAVLKEPFQPFNLHYPSGKMYAVRSANQCIVTQSGRSIVIARPNPQKNAGGFDMLDVVMAERLEVLDEAPMPLNWWLRGAPDDSPGGFHGGDAA